ncbi:MULTISPECIES: riboflavin synthase [Dietzia]|uniref:riboflavin synthase n=1 Tax=Dietzia TaxID=37914 RepID=UPI0015FA1D73|nr:MULTISPECIES: riboflavin synthase [Dietzia]MBC7297220.1 riboflavin synthase [Dietzia sp.]MBB1033099.1 riboflavin synthase [Dietzia sp. CQ4]MBB1050592.1 riboflavin synthase [Dietzia sp. CW19]MBB1056190.1 riboflavin synthase [Dietzia sp. B19]MCT1514956.1 riboflavin synthase [Dietzia cercidiphylli]
MFTGIVEELGTLESVETVGDSARLRIRGPLVTSDARHGESISVNGVCLTVTEFTAGEGFDADVMAETLDRTALGALSPGDPVNLERAMRADARFGGHIVQGHVDGTGAVISRTEHDQWHVVRISLPQDLARYVVEKGSITVSGTSLTVSAVSALDQTEPWFEVSLIPTTLEDTILGGLTPGDAVNLEVDVLAKYVERLLGGRGGRSR